MPDSHITKAAGILISDRKLLFVRPYSKTMFFAPGGKPDAGETLEEALVRELAEELDIQVNRADLAHMATYSAEAAGQPGKVVEMHCYLVKSWEGDVAAQAEIAELAWFGSDVPDGIEVGSIFGHEVLPELKRRDLID